MKKIIILIIMLIFSTSKVNAQTIQNYIDDNGYYLNQQNITISKNNYDKIKEILTADEIEMIDERFYSVINESNNILAIKSAVLESKYYTIGNDRFLIEENILTQNEYNKVSTLEYDVHDTDYKHIKLMAEEKSNGKIRFYIQNSWLLSPSNKSFDVLGLRWEGSVTKDVSTSGGLQDYKEFYTQVNPPTIKYASTSNNIQHFSNGMGLSQNLVDDASYFVNVMSIEVNCSGQVNLYGTYQHAQGTLTLAQSKSYTLSSNGLGKVLYYSNSTIRNTYDNTAGLSVSFTC